MSSAANCCSGPPGKIAAGVKTLRHRFASAERREASPAKDTERSFQPFFLWKTSVQLRTVTGKPEVCVRCPVNKEAFLATAKAEGLYRKM